MIHVRAQQVLLQRPTLQSCRQKLLVAEHVELRKLSKIELDVDALTEYDDLDDTEAADDSKNHNDTAKYLKESAHV